MDFWRIEEEKGLVRIENQYGAFLMGENVYWTRHNDAWMRRVHKTVLKLADETLRKAGGRWLHVSVLCHYVHVRESDCETMLHNQWKPPRAYSPRKKTDELANGFKSEFAGLPPLPRRRGRPRKKLPDWL